MDKKMFWIIKVCLLGLFILGGFLLIYKGSVDPNIGAHMEKDINLIIEAEPKEAQLLIGLIETLIKDWYIVTHDRKKNFESITKVATSKAAEKKSNKATYPTTKTSADVWPYLQKPTNSKGGYMRTIITSLNWGSARIEDIQKVLDSVTEVLDSYFEETINYDVLVEYNPGTPIVLYKRGINGEYQVQLSAKDRFWAQYSYQFSHEYCHIRTNYINGKQKSKWFEETICELASLFTLRRMAEIWKINPPYQGWRDYADHLFSYAEGRIIDNKHKLQKGQDFHAWFSANLASLEKDQYIRESNTLIAIKLLPLFEENTKLWVAMKYFNTWDTLESDDIFSSFAKWLEIVPDEVKPCVVELINVFKSKT